VTTLAHSSSPSAWRIGGWPSGWAGRALSSTNVAPPEPWLAITYGRGISAQTVLSSIAIRLVCASHTRFAADRSPDASSDDMV
jgi:hypothetical protein